VRGRKHPHWTAPDGSPETWGHFGRSGTFVWWDPEAALGLVVLTDREFGPWAAEAWPALSARVLAEHR
jgi:CubicO group peptidase (beta-lactamase class C family)